MIDREYEIMEDSFADRQPRILTWMVVVTILLLGFVLRGQFPVYFPNNFGHEPMFQYRLAAFTRLLGQRAFTSR